MYFFEKSPGILDLFTLSLEIPEKANKALEFRQNCAS